MAQDTHRVHWKVVHGADASSDGREKQFKSLTRALEFIRDKSDAATGTVGEAYARLVTDGESVGKFDLTEEGVVVAPDSISLIKDAWERIDD